MDMDRCGFRYDHLEKKKKRKREEIERGFYNLPCETESVSNVALTFAIISRM